MNYHLCIIYDSITNSVFESQLLIPFADYLKTYPHDRGLLISFEQTIPEQKYQDILAAYPTITLIILKKIRFYGSISLYYAAYQLAKILKNYTILSVRARGPLAGWIAGHTPQLKDTPTIVQARGLAGQEYAYCNPKNILHNLRRGQYEAIEKWAYGIYAQRNRVTIHAVSTALKEYLIDHFNAPADKITVERYDIPPSITANLKAQWRHKIRAQLAIPHDAYLYIYSGSAKAWQCPEQTIAYVAERYVQNKKLFFLVLTQDQSPFKKLCATYKIPEQNYRIMHVAHSQIYRYLAAADAGIILREKHPINWVSRPTKVLEYQTLGLTIVHNNTIAMLAAQK